MTYTDKLATLARTCNVDAEELHKKIGDMAAAMHVTPNSILDLLTTSLSIIPLPVVSVTISTEPAAQANDANHIWLDVTIPARTEEEHA